MDIIKKIKEKKELSSLQDSFIQYIINKIKAKNERLLIKEARKELRRLYGSFQIKNAIKKREIYLNEILESLNKKEFNLEAHKNILKTHRSTKERLEIYEELYKNLPKFKTIQDLACGLNPFSLIFMKNLNIKYYALDIQCQELNLIKEYFKSIKNNFSEFDFEIKAINLFQKIPEIKTDLAFLFKFIDLLESKKEYKLSEEIIKNINANYLIVSFSKITLGRKKMHYPRRKWFELMLKRLNYNYKILEYENEIFYLISKTTH
ncbi:hypothetical protein HY498_03935 [Candidatus Woesearchaeota archaeon]|nr:hypothetical protein [Candidatus Woesearchaeota archaeon]